MDLSVNMRHSFAMEQWEDQGIVLSVRRHGENGAVVGLLTLEHGRYSGYVRGGQGSRMRGTLELGNIVDARWQSRDSDSLGGYNLELVRNASVHVLDDPQRLAALQSVCGLCEAAMPEREVHSGLYHGSLALFDALRTEMWAAAYVMWEIAFLRELGFSLDLSACAGGGDGPLGYVSPKTGRAVSFEAGEAYKDKLLPLPGFLVGQGGVDDVAVAEALAMTGYFLEHWAFAQASGGMPEARRVFMERMG